jgi:UDP-glucuronate 4-epimerase
MTFRNVVVTGAAGFIGMHAAEALCRGGRRVLGIDNLNAYYSPELKRDRLARLKALPNFEFAQADVADGAALNAAVGRFRPEAFIHLAAQAGVRHSLTHPEAYVQGNLVGFANVLEACRQHKVGHLVYASSSSVYGMNKAMPFSARDNVDHPMSLYAATKKANEVMAHCYSHLYALPTTGLRFFTVYGPWGRPDMALYKFTKAILAGETIELYNHGDMRRDFTYVDDVTDALVRLVDRPPAGQPFDSSGPDPSMSPAPFRIYNVGNNKPEPLLRLVELLEQALGRRATRNLLPMQPGDVTETFADIEDLRREVGFEPKTPIEVGIPRFVEWYRMYHKVR